MSTNPPAPLLSKDDLFVWVARRLGEPLNPVELTIENYEDGLVDALQWFTAKKGIKAQKRVSIQAMVNEYPLDDDMDTIVDVTFQSNPLDFSYIYTPSVLAEQQLPYSAYASPATGGVYSTFVQNMQYIESAKRILGADPDWRQVGRNLVIFPIPKAGTTGNSIVGEMLITYKLTAITLNQLNNKDYELIKRYVLAFAKKDLGTIRSRYTVYPGAQGPVPSDGPRLLQESEQEFAKLNVDIERRGYPIYIVTG